MFFIVHSHIAWGSLILPSRSYTSSLFHPTTITSSAVSPNFVSYRLERFKSKTCNLGFKTYWLLPRNFSIIHTLLSKEACSTPVGEFVAVTKWVREGLWSSSGAVPCFSLCTTSALLVQWDAFLTLTKKWYFGKTRGVFVRSCHGAYGNITLSDEDREHNQVLVQAQNFPCGRNVGISEQFF